MAFILEQNMPWHEGEDKMHSLMHVPYRDNPGSPFLTPGAAYLLQKAPMIALGTLDSEGRPWTTVWGGESGMAQQVASSIVGFRTLVDRNNDPVVETLLGGGDDGEVVREEGQGRMVSGLAIELETRKRVKIYGRMVAGALSQPGGDDDDEADEGSKSRGEVQLVVKIEESLGNCPKYLNRKQIFPSLPEPKLVSGSPQLPQRAIDLLAKADLFFVSSSAHKSSMDTNHRGGPPGFVRVVSNTPSGAVLVWPEYSGNRLYQTLGNLQTTPLAGLVFPDFDTSDVLYLTGKTEILLAKDAATLLPRSNLAVKITLAAARFVEKGLPFRGQLGERSPYNPTVRYLPTEKIAPGPAQEIAHNSMHAKLMQKQILTPTIARFRFRILDPAAGIAAGTGAKKWKPGQYVALSFADELDFGYSHMRDDDPRSLNDDFLRTFTVSSHPDAKGVPDGEFEITVRNVGHVTSYLFRQDERHALEIPLRGFGGEFRLEQKKDRRSIVPFIASGIGITPALAQLPELDIERFRLFWSVGVKDAGLVHDTFRLFPELPKSSVLFLTGDESGLSGKDKKVFTEVNSSGAKIERRRLQSQDLEGVEAEEWYTCTGTVLRTSILNWLAAKRVIYEDFSY